MEVAYDTIIGRPVDIKPHLSLPVGLDGERHPFVVTLGGDHTIVMFCLVGLYIGLHYIGLSDPKIPLQKARANHGFTFRLTYRYLEPVKNTFVQ